MTKPTRRAYSRYTQDALELLANLIHEGRIANRMTAQDLAERAGISRALLHRIEKGDPGCSVGVVLEVAALVGIPLFDGDRNTVRLLRDHSREMKALLPKMVRIARGDVKDDF